MPKSTDAQLGEVKSHVSTSWLSQPDEDGTFPTNGDRFAAQELTKRRDTQGLTRTGFLCQLVAVVWHAKSARQLQQLGDRVGRERIQVLHGTGDSLISIPHAETLVKGLGGAEGGVTKVLYEGRGHYLPFEEEGKCRVVLEAMIEKAEAL